MATPVRLKDIPLEATSFADVDEFILDSSANGTRTISGANIKTQLGGLFVKPLDSIADLSTEAAGAGYVRIVSDLDRGGIFKAVNGGTPDGIDIFASATSGWTWQRIRGSWIDITTAGALGDDSSDNYNVIQLVFNTLETLGGGVCYVPHGIFRVSSQLLIPSNVALFGGGFGSVIKATWTALGDHPDYYIIANKNRAHWRYINESGEATKATGSLTTGESLTTDENIIIKDIKLTATAYTNADYTSNTFSFTSGGNTVTDSANQFLAQGFSTSQKLYVIDGTGNVGSKEITSVTSGTITVSATFASTTSGQTRRLVGYRHRAGIWLGRVKNSLISNVWLDNVVNFAWNVNCWGTGNVVEKVKTNSAQEVTEDGIQIIGSNNFVDKCHVVCGDDPVVIKSCEYEIAENNFVSNFFGDSNYGQLRINPNYKTVDGVFLDNCKFISGRKRGNCYNHNYENGADQTNLKNVFLSNVEFHHDPDGNHSGANATAFNANGGTNLNYSNVTIRNAVATTGGSFFVLDLRDAENVTFDSFKIVDPQNYLANGVNVQDSICVTFDGGRFDNIAFTVTDTDRVKVEGAELTGIEAGAAHAISFVNCDNITCTDNNTYGASAYEYGCRIQGTSVNATVSGNQFQGATRNVSVLGDLSTTSYIGDNGPTIETGTITDGVANANGARVLLLKGQDDLADILLDITRGQTGQFLMIKKHSGTPSLEVRNTGVDFPIDVASTRTIDTNDKYLLLYCNGVSWNEIVNGT